MIPCNKWALNFTMQHFEKTHKNWRFSDHCLSRLLQCISMKLGTFFQWSFLVILNKPASTCMNIFGNTAIQSLKSGKIGKSGVVPMSRQENLRIIPAILCQTQNMAKLFHSYLFTKPSRNEA